jgi:hypothetical protein
MKDIKAFSDSELLEKTRQVVAEERRITARVLAHLEEVERRQLYLSLECSSLFEYCQKDLKYSESEANARISAMRLSREVPEVVQAVSEGRLSLTNLVKARTYFNKTPMALEQKRELLSELEGLTTRECVRRLEPDAPQRKTFEVDDELLADLQRIREIWGNQDLSDTELLRKMAKLVLARIDPEAKKSPVAPKVQAPDAQEPKAATSDTPPAELVTPETRHIPAAIKRAVWARDRGRCTYAGCRSRYAIQFDHVIPYSHGGAHTASNLRLLCRAHHRARVA